MKVITSYEPFSQQPEYIEANREFLGSLPLDAVRQVLDLACGTGTLTDLLFELRSGIRVIGLDISAESLDIGRKIFRDRNLLVDDLTALDAGPGVMLIEGSADQLEFAPESFDLVVMGNAIHLMADLDRFMASVRQVLRPGGVFAFNSSFFVGTFFEETEAIYTEWLKEALAVLNQKNEALRLAGLKKIPRQRGKGGRAFQKEWLTPEQWSDRLSRNGFQEVKIYKRRVNITQAGFETVGAYAGLAEVLMSGYPVEIASECLQEGAKRLFQKLPISEVPRYWLEITAIKQ